MGADWGPAVVAVAMFIVFSPGLLFQLPARTRMIEFGNMYTSGISILNGNSTRLKVPELNDSVPARNLNQQARRQQYEQYHRHKNWAPVGHL
ncbi:Protein of unknown function (DUF 3339 [Striga hermonthica]|uniref:Uncharacterized protein n=1 Tax=Striga hermonthica TaxID=68872 RepID=A0A9N7R4H0_STRHE|nr:Protein of unknown function (DUF 3339 [Striga hermonthica]